MTYREQTVRPSFRVIGEYITEMGMNYTPEEVYHYWRDRKWEIRKGEKVKTIEWAVKSYHQMKEQKRLNREMRKAQKALKRQKKAEDQRRRFQEFLKEAYHIYTDGSCDNYHSRIGGAGYIILKDGEMVKKNSKGFCRTTNNRMEMLAIISALNSLPENSSAIVYTDSKYCITVLDGYMHEKNQDLIQLFCKIRRSLGKVVFEWVKGHSGNKFNEMADELALSAYREMCEKMGKPVSARMLKTH